MEQILQACEISMNPGASQDLKRQAMEFLQQVKDTDDHWQACLQLFVEAPRDQDSSIARIFVLDVVSNAISRRLQSGGDADAFALIKDTLLTYAKNSYGPGSSTYDNAAIQNKVAQVVTHLFVAMYGSQWTSYFDDLLQLTSTSGAPRRDNIAGVVFYLRVMSAIHDEVADVFISRSSEEAQRATVLKDHIRERDVGKLVTSWHEILTEWREQSVEIVQMTLAVIQKWTSWINISLVVTPDFVEFLWGLLTSTSVVKIASMEAMAEIVGKKMSASDKMDLIEFMRLLPMTEALTTQDPTLQPKSANYDVNLAEKVGKLVNNVGSELVRAANLKNEQDFVRASRMIQELLPAYFRCFSNDYDEVSQTVFPFTTELLSLYRQYRKENNSLPEEFRGTITQILGCVIAKMQYDEAQNWGDEDEQTEEAEFENMRKKLKNMQDIVGAIDTELLMNTLSTLITSAFERLSQGGVSAINWRELELALYELQIFGDLAFQNGNLFVKKEAGIVPNGPAAVKLVEMMSTLIGLNIAAYPHAAMHLYFMELVVRYVSIFEVHKDFIPVALETFITGCHSSNQRVRPRAWYLLTRFVKIVRNHIGGFAETVIRSIGDLLTIKAEPSEDDDDMSSEGGKSQDTTFESQLNLFEVVGSLASTHSIPVENQVQYARQVITPIFADIEKNLPVAQGGDKLAIKQVHHDMMALGTLARGYSDWVPGSKSSAPAPAPAVTEEFQKVSEAILVSLENLNNDESIRDAARFSFSRMVGVMGTTLLPQLPRWIEGLLGRSSSKGEIQMFLRLLEQIVHGFKNDIYEILNTLITPLLEGLFNTMSEPVEGTDDAILLAELRREFLGFILVIINNDLGRVFVSEVNLRTYQRVIEVVEHFAKDSSDPQTQKLAFGVIAKLCSNEQVMFPGFEQLIEKFSTICWSVPTTAGFNPKDAQARIVLGEIGAVQRAIYQKAGEGFLQYLGNVYFPSVGASQALIEQYLTSLRTKDEREFKKYFRDFVTGLIS